MEKHRKAVVLAKVEEETGAFQAGSTSSVLKLATGASAVDDFYNGMYIAINSGTYDGEYALIVDYDGSAKDATVAPALSGAPAAADDYRILTYGVDAVPVVGTNAILTSVPEGPNPVGSKIERSYAKATYGPAKHVNVGEAVEVSFECEARGSGAAGTAPENGPLLRACGMSETITAATKVDYDPATNLNDSVTLWVWRDNHLIKIRGCVGSVEFSTEVNKEGIFKFSFTGLYAGPEDSTIPTNASYDSVVPPAFRNAGFTIGGYAATIAKLAINHNVELKKRMDANAASGISQHFIGGWSHTGSFDPEVEAISVKDFWADWYASTAAALSATLGASAGNKLIITGPQAVYETPKRGEREGISIYDMSFGLYENTGDDQVKYSFQ